MLIASHVHLETQEKSDEALIQSMKDSAVAKIVFADDDCGYIGVFHDQNEAGECSAQPHLRPPPMRESGNHLKHAVGLRVRATSPDEENELVLGHKDSFFLPDAGKDGNRKALLEHLTNLKKDIR